jgi:SAM-dependent methyltransferase
VEFHLATIDKLPLEANSVDCVISNCVLNLAPDKPAVFREIFRVLKPGGRLAVSDIALKQTLPEELKQSVAAYSGCIAGALPLESYRKGLLEAGFLHVEIVDSGKDLNAYAKVENQAGCCSPAMTQAAALPIMQSSCCGGPAKSVHEDLKTLLERYDVNEYAASVRVFALKP